jgi:hypothetical protein
VGALLGLFSASSLALRITIALARFCSCDFSF